ncbi:MAG TPA: EAL domain-containing protein [Falsiroseomonas sp.]|jgi:EAL domain-containing protein (putative c-di-GMP-specific phosphodiesterase class I)|nr:EAL domain-containing protein [Falsiroseomonas sp.]
MVLPFATLPAPEGGQPHGAIRMALEAVRKHLGMEVAYVSEFVDGRSVFREVDAPGLEALIKVGDSRSLDDVYCRHILAGRLPELIADTADYPLAVSMPITRAVPIGAHASVPIRLADGRPYGMFCCLSPDPNHSLNQRDLQVMKAFAEVAAHQIRRDVAAEQEVSQARAQIEQVIEQDLFTIAYQPIFSFEPFEVMGFEALSRFSPQPYRSPDLWFEQAAWAGCGVTLELAAIRKAVGAFRTLPDSAFLSVNAAPGTIASGQLGGALRGMPMNRLVIEVTEHVAVQDYGRLGAELSALRRLGARIAVDDAGAGYAGLQHILQLQPDIIKFDRTITRAVDQDLARRAMVSALRHFARDTGSQIVAEGVETQPELAALIALGVNKGQGYLIGRPLDLAGARALLMPQRLAA